MPVLYLVLAKTDDFFVKIGAIFQGITGQAVLLSDEKRMQNVGLT